MAYNAATAAANKAATAVATVQDLTEALLGALRLANQADPPPTLDIVTIGQTSDRKLDRLVFCPDCLGRDGPAWGSHEVYFMAADEARPGQVKRVAILHPHPQVRKTISYDQSVVKAGLDDGTYGKQCLQCGHALQVA